MTIRRRSVRMVRSLHLDRPINAVAGSLVAMTTDEPVIHLTYDDGPHPEVTPKVLDVLDEHRVAATFFLLTEPAQRHPDLVSDIVRRGHHVALHTRTHPRLTEVTWSRLLDEIRDARRDLEEVTQREISWFRPPYGAQNLRSLAVTRTSGMKTMLWSVDSHDWVGLTGQDPLHSATAPLAPGGILLMHDTPVGDNERDDATRGYLSKDQLTRLYLAELHDLGLHAVSLETLLSSGIQHRRAKLG